jgi:hypothetical protein
MLLLILTLLLATAGCSVPDESPAGTLPANTNLAQFALTPADLPFPVVHMDNESVTAAPGHFIQDNRDILREYHANFIDSPGVTPTMIYLKQDIALFAHGTTDTNFNSTYRYYQNLQAPDYSVTMLDSPGVGDRSFAFSLLYDKGPDRINPVTGIAFARSDITEIIQMRAGSVDEAAVIKIARAADRKITNPGEPPAGTPVTPAAVPKETIPPEILDGSDNSPSGVVRQYYTSMDAGNYTAATDLLLPNLRPGADWAGAKRRSVALDKELYGLHGEKIQYANLSLDAWQQVGDCDIHLPDLKKICQDNHFDLVFNLRISYDEMDVLESGPSWHHYNDSVYAARYNGTWYLIL